MSDLRGDSTKNTDFIQSFELTGGNASGDLLSEKIGHGPLKVGFLGTAYFEYYRMYEGLEECVHENLGMIASFLKDKCELIDPGVVDTLDKSHKAGVLFAEKGVDAVVIAEATYSVDYLVHQTLLRIPDGTPLLLFASQAAPEVHYEGGYRDSLLNSGPMGIVQFSCSLQKMNRHLPYTVVVGCITEACVQEEIETFIKVRKAVRDLHDMNIGLIGHIFRGMYDFQYDKTELTGRLGPHVIDIDIKHLSDIYDELRDDDPAVEAMIRRSKEQYCIAEEVRDIDLLKAAKLGTALEELMRRYKLDAMALLGQHFIEARTQTTSYLGIADILARDLGLVVTEGDVLGLIVSFVMKELAGSTPFFGEWEEVDIGKNAVLILGHGFLDPRTARPDRPVHLGRSCEDWGWEGCAPGFECTFAPGPVTLSAVVSHNGSWKMLISEGVIRDTPPLRINESTLLIETEEDVREYFRHVVELGFGHHIMVVQGKVGKALAEFAKIMGMEVCRP